MNDHKAGGREFADQICELAEAQGISRHELIMLLKDYDPYRISLLKKKHKTTSDIESMPVLKTVGILGAGHITRGLAKMFAVRGVQVIIRVDSTENEVFFKKFLEKNLDWMIAKWELTPTEKKLIFQQIRTTAALEDLAGAEIIFDTMRSCIIRRNELYAKLESVIQDDCILAVDDETVSLGRISPELSFISRVIGMHFAYPASRRGMVEMIRGKHTSNATYIRALQVARYLKKKVFDVFETPGGISSRVMMPMINEAIQIWSEGVATPTEIDEAVKLAMNIPIGPMEYADTVGLDTVINVMENMWRATGLVQHRPAQRLRLMVRLGFLGKKSGQGFHSYDSEHIGEAP